MDTKDVSRELASYEAVLNSPGNCRVTTKWQAPAPVSIAISTGTMFSVTAKQDIEILSFEFSHFPYGAALDVEIYFLANRNYEANRNAPGAWTKLSSTTSVDSPDASDSDINIAPRADMTQGVVLAASQSASFYVTLKSQHLKLERSSAGKPLSTGQVYHADNFLSTEVGIGVRLGDFPTTQDDRDRGFPGRIHYRAIQSCSELLGQTQVVVKAAVPTAQVPQSPNEEFLTALTNHLNARAGWKRWTELDGLNLQSVQASVAETKTDCSAYGISGGCTLYDNKLTMVHYASLPGKKVELEVIRSIVESDNTVTFGASSTMTYVGPRVLSRYFQLQLFGTPTDTILNPIQRDYIATVTLDFLKSYSESVPSLVEVISQELSRRELRDGRQLQGTVTAEAYIYGLGDDVQAFYEPIETAFLEKETEYRTQLQREQYRPSAINDAEDFGAAFKDLFRVKVRTNETVSNIATGTAEDDDYDEAGVVVCSILIALSLLVLIYRCVKDCLMKQDGHGIKKQTVSEHNEQQRMDGVVKQGRGNYLYGGRDQSARATEAKSNKPNAGRRNGPGKKKKKGPPPPGGGKRPGTSPTRSNGSRRPGASPPRNNGARRPGASPPRNSAGSNNQKKKKKPGKKKRPLPNVD